jgi:hypothetical protein
LHPLLRETLTRAGYDVSQLTDRALMTVQNVAQIIADGNIDSVAVDKQIKEYAQATSQLFEKENI